MFQETLPEHLSYRSVRVLDSSAIEYPGKAAIREWTLKEAFWRGFRKAAKIASILIGITLPFAFLEPFAFMVWGSVTVVSVLLFVGPFLHMKFWAESVTFFYVESECPYCHKFEKLKPYVSTAYQETFAVLCPSCGVTSRVRPANDTVVKEYSARRNPEG